MRKREARPGLLEQPISPNSYTERGACRLVSVVIMGHLIGGLLWLCCATCISAADDLVESPSLLVSIDKPSQFPHLTVVLQNSTKMPLRIWDDSNSWGWWNLRFCVVATNGGTYYVRRKCIDFYKNTPDFVTIDAAKEQKRVVNLADGWWDLPKELDFKEVVYISAVYAVQPTAESREFVTWTGVTVSPWIPFRQVQKVEVD